MHLLKGIVIAFSMYSGIPMPRMEWKEEDMRYALCFFPLVGAVIGGFCYAWLRICEAAGIASLARSCVCAAIPLLIAGGIHMTFGDEQALTIGVDSRKMKKILIAVSAFLTGIAVCFTGVIGFIDLIAPHVVRRVFGSSHRYVLPMSVLFGGAFMAIADLVSRTVLSPQEIPVGSVTALIGAPFFAYVFFRGNRR